MKINPVKVAHELAMADACSHSYLTIYRLNPQIVRETIEKGSINGDKVYKYLREVYQAKYDYYFEFLTNLLL